ncbi:calcium/sodium antiporter [Methylophaga sulfidovorans]|uniref:Cation:H+ antiporter n=1 Tax=Methylophaga sulfidovorans TaxID=45496 RepID=A0A1I3U5H3_9GAMM|nr:calcium/sodium antiporter [Methylophaga sulfidovorans]SFJ78162.1 cation:H+ antiporter [Methylophaga sulfidovorans]
MTTILFISAIIAGFVILIWGADRFVDGAANIATNFGVSPLIVGLTIVGFGTSAPEMLVSALAAIDGAPALGIGNAIGSNITNIGLVLAITLLIAPLTVHSDTLKREFPVLLFVMALSLVLMLDGDLNRMDGIILFSGFIFTLAGMAWLAIKGANKQDPLEAEFETEYGSNKMTAKQATFYFVIGLIALLVGSKSLVWGATGIAHLLGVSDLIIGLTVVAIGTSLPELAASVVSALKNEHDIAVGNILGSNIFNILAVLAMPGLIAPSQIDPMLLYRDIPFMIGLSVGLYLFARFSQNGRIGRVVGVLMLFVYVAYNGLLVYQNTPGLS